MIVLPELNKDPHKLEEICAGFDLQPRGSSGEHSAAVGAKWDISNKQRIGFTEVQLVQKMIDGVTKLIALSRRSWLPRTRASSCPRSSPSFDQWLSRRSSRLSPPDAKDTDEFRYITFTELPPFTDASTSR